MRTTIPTFLLAARAVNGSVLPRQEYDSALLASPTIVYVTQFSTIYAESSNAASLSTAVLASEVVSSVSPSEFLQYGTGLPRPSPSSSIVLSVETSATPVHSSWNWPVVSSATMGTVLPVYSVGTSAAIPLVSSSDVLASSSATTELASAAAAPDFLWRAVHWILSLAGKASIVVGAPTSSVVAAPTSSVAGTVTSTAALASSSVALPASSAAATTATTVLASSSEAPNDPRVAVSSILSLVGQASSAIGVPTSSVAEAITSTSTLVPTTTATSASSKDPFWFLKSKASLASATAPNCSVLTSNTRNPLEGRTTLTLSTPPAIPASRMTFRITSSAAAAASSTAIVVVPITPSSTAIVIQPVGTPSPSLLPRADEDLPPSVLAIPTLTRAPRPTKITDIEDITQTSTTTIKTTMTVKPLLPTLSFLLPPASAYPTKSDGGEEEEVYTSVLTPDSRCPYPYPGIYCGEGSTTLVTRTKSGTEEETKTASATCGYPGQDLLC